MVTKTVHPNAGPVVRPKRSSARAVFIVIGAFVLTVVMIGAAWWILFQPKLAMFKEMGRPKPQGVSTTVVQSTTWPNVLTAIGSLEAVNGVVLSADLPGVIDKISFESGTSAKAGDVLLQLSVAQEEAQLKSAIAKRDLAAINLDRQRALRDMQTNSKSDYDTAEANFRDMEATVANAKATIERKTIKAPFAGALGVRMISQGQYVNSGDKIVSLQALDPVRVNFSLPQQAIAQVQTGKTVRVRSDATGSDVFTGTVNAINSKVDEATRTVLMQATFANPDSKLRPGMFVNVEVELPATDEVLPIPSSSINYAPFGNSVFVVEQMKDPEGATYLGVRQQFVKTGATRGDLVAITSGLKVGEQVVTGGTFRLQNKGLVVVNNEVKPSENPNPKLPDT